MRMSWLRIGRSWAKAQAEEAAARAKESEDEEDDEDDEDEFEDVDVSGTGANGTPLRNGIAMNGTKDSASGMNTPNRESSNATDDERDAKRVRIEETVVASSSKVNGGSPQKAAEDTPAASDEDEDELEFENV